MAQGGNGGGSAGGLYLDPERQCDGVVAHATACRAKIGEPFVAFAIGPHQGRYTHGCDPQCGNKEGPTFSQVEEGPGVFLSACELGQLVSLAFGRESLPYRISIAPDQNVAADTEYALSDWMVNSGSSIFMGTAHATNIADSSDAGTLELSWNICP